MSVNYNVTTIGLDLIALAQTGKELKFTNIVLGDGELAEGQTAQDMTELVNEVLTLPLNYVDAPGNGTVKLGGPFSNADLATGFWYREIGVKAIHPDSGEEVLYCYGNAGADAEWLGAYATPKLIEKNIFVNTVVGTAANITAVISSEIAVTREALDQHNADPGAHMPAITAHNTSRAAHADIREMIEAGAGAKEALAAHNVATDAHQDIRTALAGKVDGAAITTHNNDASAHPAIWTALSDKANLTELDATRSAIETIENKLSGERLALGKDAAASTTGIVIGAESRTNSSHAIVVGNSASSSSAGGSVTIGYTASCGASGSIATGSIAIGQAATCAKGYSVALGFNTRISGEYSTALGPQASVAESDSGVMQLGSTSSTYLSALRCRVALSQVSDERDKADIAPIGGALDFIRQVQTIRYVDNARVKYLPPEEEQTAEQQELMRKYGLCHCYDEQAHAAGVQKGERKRVGVSAQQVQEALAAVYGSADYANIVNDNLHDVKQREELPRGVESQLTVNYSGFVPFLIQAVQELARRVEELEGIPT